MQVDLNKWIGRRSEEMDIAAPGALAALAAILDHAQPPWRKQQVPPLGHWLYFLPRALQSEMGEDGHPRRGGLLPPVALPRRMWAGSRLAFHTPIPIGDTLQRVSLVKSIEYKSGSTGDLVFVTVEHELSNASGLLLTEEQDIVYREATPAASPSAARDDSSPTAEPDWTQTVVPDPVLLFRFSALTFNAHRIHYDRRYSTEVEGYPGLVVHAPLMATLMMDSFLRRHPGAWVNSFEFRARRPLFDGRPGTISGKRRHDGADLWVLDDHGTLALSARLGAH